jgi:hypothetical protein
MLAKDDSDDERSKPAQTKTQHAKPKAHPAKPSERSEQEKQLREVHGDRVQKDTVSHKRSSNGPRNKGDYAPGEKRPFERHSGTGRPAFANNFKKGGHGKGNVGGEDETKKELRNGEAEVNGQDQNQAPVEDKKPEIEEIITADEYIAKAGLNINLGGEAEVKNVKPPVINDPNLKIISQKVKDLTFGNSKKTKNPDNLIQGSKNIIEDSTAQKGNFNNRRKNSPPKQKRVEYNDVNFPALG